MCLTAPINAPADPEPRAGPVAGGRLQVCRQLCTMIVVGEAWHMACRLSHDLLHCGDRWLSEADAAAGIWQRHRQYVSAAWRFLNDTGYINFGVAPALQKRMLATPASKQSVVIIGAGMAGGRKCCCLMIGPRALFNWSKSFGKMSTNPSRVRSWPRASGGVCCLHICHLRWIYVNVQKPPFNSHPVLNVLQAWQQRGSCGHRAIL